MSKRIIYPNNDGGISIIVPVEDCGLSVDEIARKDVPQGKPFIIVEESDIPTDRTFRNAWEASFNKPTGYGIGQEAWFAEQAAKENNK